MARLNALSAKFTNVDAQCDKLATVVSRTKLTTLATVDAGPMSLAMQFITLSVRLCVQHVAREAARRAVHLRQLILVVKGHRSIVA